MRLFNSIISLIALCALILVPIPTFAAGTGGAMSEMLGLDAALVTGTFLGIIGASFIYLFFTWLVIRDRSQIFLALMVLCMALHLIAVGGYLDMMQMKGVGPQFVAQGALLVFYVLSCFFTTQYMEFDVTQHGYRHVLTLSVVVLVVAIIVGALDPVFLSLIMPWLSLAVLSVLMIASFVSYTGRSGGGLPLFSAFGVIFIGQLNRLPVDWQQSMFPIFGYDFVAVSFALCSMLFAMVIATQFARRQELKERELARSKERFKLAAQGSNEGLFEWDFLSQKGYFSERLTRIFGINLSQHRTREFRTWLKIVHPQDRKPVIKTIFNFLRSRKEKILSLEYRLKKFDGRNVWVTTTAIAVRDKQNGDVTRLIGSVGDITEKKRAEVSLKASEKRFRSIAEAHPVPVLIAGVEDGIILYASQGCEAALGAPVKNLIGRSLSLFLPEIEHLTAILDAVRKKGRVDSYEVTLNRADHAKFPAAISGRLIEYERRPCAVLGLYDLSERKAAETKIKDTQEALQQSEKLAALGGLLAGVAHELNNPLSVIVGQAVLMKENAKDDKTVQRSEKIQKAGERCSRIVRSFLALARRKTSERTPVSINEIIENSLELLAFQLRTDNVELIRKLSPNLPAAMADGDQLTQIITNLVINAKHALAEKQGPRIITVETWLGAGAAGTSDGSIYVAVMDNGPGVPKDLVKRIFEPFFTTKPAGSGTGVGLSLCHSIIESHGGRIWVEDAVGGGARFIFFLPGNRNEQAGENLEAMTENLNTKIPPQRVLIVDDEVELAQTLSDILTPDGHKTRIVHNGKEALGALASDTFDFIISDLRMPVMDGPTMYRTLEKQGSPYTSRIIFVTGDTLSIPVRDFLNEYKIEVIEKPYTPADVRRAIIKKLTEVKS